MPETRHVDNVASCSYIVRVKSVGLRDLKNRLTSYLKLAKANREVIVTERGRAIAVIQPIGSTGAPQSLEARIAALASQGEISAPEKGIVSRIRRIRVSGRPLSEEIVAERRLITSTRARSSTPGTSSTRRMSPLDTGRPLSDLSRAGRPP